MFTFREIERAVREFNPSTQMRPSKKIVNHKSRAAVKMASRRADRQRLDHGESPEAIQQENSIFPPGYFERHRILNFASAIGR